MTWAYFNDGQLKQRTDQGGPTATYGHDVNNNLTRALDTAGVTDPGEGLTRVPVAERVQWGAQERGAFIRGHSRS